MILNLALCFFFGWALPVLWIQLTLLVQHWTILNPDSLRRKVEQGFSTPISSLDPMGMMDFATRKLRRSHCVGDFLMIVIVGAIASALAYWAWSRGARWSFAAAAIGFIPGSAHAMGVYRDTIKQLADILREIPGFEEERSPHSASSLIDTDLPAVVVAALDELQEAHPSALGLIRDEVVSTIQDSLTEVERQIEEGHIAPEDVARQFSCNIAGDQLEGGRHHIYRGTLTDAGRSLLSFYAACWRVDVDRKFTTEEKAEEEIAAMHRIVREIG